MQRNEISNRKCKVSIESSSSSFGWCCCCCCCGALISNDFSSLIHWKNAVTSREMLLLRKFDTDTQHILCYHRHYLIYILSWLFEMWPAGAVKDCCPKVLWRRKRKHGMLIHTVSEVLSLPVVSITLFYLPFEIAIISIFVCFACSQNPIHMPIRR